MIVTLYRYDTVLVMELNDFSANFVGLNLIQLKKPIEYVKAINRYVIFASLGIV